MARRPLDRQEVSQSTTVEVIASGHAHGDAAVAGGDQDTMGDPFCEALAHQRIVLAGRRLNLPGVRQLVRERSEQQRTGQSQLDEDAGALVLAHEEAKHVMSRRALGDVAGKAPAHIAHLATPYDVQRGDVWRKDASRLRGAIHGVGIERAHGVLSEHHVRGAQLAAVLSIR